MIKIYEGDVFTLDYYSYDRKSILRECWKNSNCSSYRFLVYKDDSIFCALSYIDIVNNVSLNPCCLSFSPSVFNQANQIFSVDSRTSCIPILDNDDQCIFLLEFIDNTEFYDTKGTPFVAPLKLENKIFADTTYEFIDHNLFKNTDFVFFYELEQFTHKITEVILNKYPNIKIFSLDANFTLFFPSSEIVICENICELTKHISSKRGMYIYSEYNIADKIPLREQFNIYTSAEVIYTLFPPIKIRHYGELYPDKTFYLINPPSKLHGLVDIMKFTYTHLVYALQRDWVPIVNLSTLPNRYVLNDGDNMWEYFFEPVSDYNANNIYKCKNVIDMNANNINLNETFFNIHHKNIHSLLLNAQEHNFNDLVRLNQYTKDYCSKHIPPEFNSNNKILGIAMRGTDYRQTSKNCIGSNIYSQTVENVMERARQLMSQYNYDYIYLETEETEYLELFKSKFGNKLLYTEQKRITYNNDTDNKYILELIDIDNNTTTLKYLTAIYALSKCHSLISSVFCGAHLLARLWKNESFEVEEILN